MRIIEEYLRSVNSLTLLMLIFVGYFILSLVINNYVMKRKFNFKIVLIPALLGLLLFEIITVVLN